MTRIQYIAVCIMACMVTAALAQEPGATVNLTWDNPDVYQDGQPVVVVSNAVYRGTAPMQASPLAMLTATNAASVTALWRQTNVFYVTAFDYEGAQSVFGEPFVVTPIPRIVAVSNLTGSVEQSGNVVNITINMQ